MSERRSKQRRVGPYLRGTTYSADFRTIGGKQEVLKVPGENRGTSDLALAEAIYHQRWAELERKQEERRRGIVFGVVDPSAVEEAKPLLGECITRMVAERRRNHEGTVGHLKAVERCLKFWRKLWGADRDLRTVRPSEIKEGLAKLTREKYAPYSVRHFSAALSGLFTWAQANDLLPMTFTNPATLAKRPKARSLRRIQGVKEDITTEEVADLRTAARRLGDPDAVAILDFLLYTGARPSEALAVREKDVDFAGNVIRFRPNEWSRTPGSMKTAKSARVCPLWPDLRDTLRQFLNQREAAVLAGAPVRTLLFPLPGGNRERKRRSLRTVWHRITTKAGWKKGETTCYSARHCYISHRLLTTDRGGPISAYTVAAETGTSVAMIEATYAHVITSSAPRSPVVEFRPRSPAKACDEPCDEVGKGGSSEGVVTVDSAAPSGD